MHPYNPTCQHKYTQNTKIFIIIVHLKLCTFIFNDHKISISFEFRWACWGLWKGTGKGNCQSQGFNALAPILANLTRGFFFLSGSVKWVAITVQFTTVVEDCGIIMQLDSAVTTVQTQYLIRMLIPMHFVASKWYWRHCLLVPVKQTTFWELRVKDNLA